MMSNYHFTYTSVEAIARRLRNRVEVVSSSNLMGSAGAGKVDPDLIKDIVNQVESKINLALGQIYKLPLPAEATAAIAIVASIVEKLVCSEIASVHFLYTQNPQTGGDAGFGSTIRKQALEELESLLHGHGVYIPGLMKPPNLGTSVQPLILPGVTLLSELEQPDSFTRNHSVVGKREVKSDVEIDF